MEIHKEEIHKEEIHKEEIHKEEINKELRISTITFVSNISSNISLKDFYNYIEPNDKIKYIEFGTNEPKGENQKATKRSRTKKIKKFFYNQITLHVFLNKIVNVKVFNNGRIQMTGLKSKEQGINILKIILENLNNLTEEVRSKILDNISPEITKSDIVLINSDFDMKFKITQENLQRIIVSQGYYSSYEPTIYPGVNIKYYFNEERQRTGICNCDCPCDGKGKNGVCKAITVAVFNSGKIIITGGQSYKHLNTAHKFITDLINENKSELIVK